MEGELRDCAEWYYRALGPVTVEMDGDAVDLGGPQRRLVLAILLSRANQVVSLDTLVDALWPDTPPSSYRVQLHGIIYELRRRLTGRGATGAGPIVTRAPGYLLRVQRKDFDLEEFRDDVAGARQAAAASDNAGALRLLRQGLARWRGPAFSDLAHPLIDHLASAADEERLAATEEWIEASIADGRLTSLGPELIRLVAENPLRERLTGQLMTVYARTGRLADALELYRKLRRRTVAELGVEPSADLQRLHRRMLESNVESSVQTMLAWHPDDPVPVSALRVLPPDLASFTGREAEMARMLAVARAETGTATAIVAVAGMGGVGKTRLAIKVAHELAAEGHYPDGQLYVDLHGASPDSEPADPAAVLESFLRLLGVPPQGIPAGLSERSAVWRDRLAGQRTLIVLDNALDREQIAPLLPSGAGSLVIVTSRHNLALEGATAINLDVFTVEESLRLLSSVVDDGRLAAEPAAALQLVTRCGRLPLAIRLAAQKLRSRPVWPVAHFVARLDSEQGPVQSVFAVSYRTLPAEEKRVFRLLGIHPGRDFTAASVAALAGIKVPEAEDVLESLLDKHLVQQSVLHRYHLHNLLKAFAVQLSEIKDSAEARTEALSSLLDWYVHATDSATVPMRRFQVPVVRQISPSTSELPDPVTIDESTAWLDAEFPNLIAVLHVAASGQWHAHAVQLPHMMQPYFTKRGSIAEWISALRHAEAAANWLDDDRAAAHTKTDLGFAYLSAGQADNALALFQEALAQHQRLGDRAGLALTFNHLGSLYRRLGLRSVAAEHYTKALELFNELDDPARQASTLSNLGVEMHLMHRDDEALRYLRLALQTQQRIGGPGEAALRTNLGQFYARLDRHNEAIEQNLIALELHRAGGSGPGAANSLASLSFSHARIGRPEQAVRLGLEAVELARRLSYPENLCMALNTVGEAHRLAGSPSAAAAAHREALDIARRIGDVEEERRAQKGLAEGGT